MFQIRFPPAQQRGLLTLASLFGELARNAGHKTEPVLEAISLGRSHQPPPVQVRLGRGEVDVVMMADGKVANTAPISIK
ncbi:MAG: hypothetical protein ACREAB_07500 [Blastocatellia bacterium]